MKNKLTIALACLGSSIVYSQSPKVDTIYCNSTSIVHIIFDLEVEDVTVGAPSLYDGKKFKNQANVKSVIPNSKNPKKPVQSNIMVRFKDSDDFYHAILKYSKNPPLIPIDKRHPEFQKKKAAAKANVVPESEESPEQNTVANKVDYSVIKKRKNMILEEKDKYEQLSVISNNILLQAPNIKNDEYFTYLKLKIRNKSSVDYVVDYIAFEIKEKLKKSVNKNHKIENEIKEDPQLETKFTKISAYDEKMVVFALPIFATGNGSSNFLLVTLREKNGTRKIELKIPIKYFVKAELF